MKLTKWIVFVVALLLLIFCVGCSSVQEKNPLSEKEDAIPFSDLYVVMAADGAMQKLNILTGEQSSLCPDPICPHTNESGCPFSLVGVYCIAGNDIYFVRDGALFTDEKTGERLLPETIMRYNYQNGTVQELCTVNGTQFEGYREGWFTKRSISIFPSRRQMEEILPMICGVSRIPAALRKLWRYGQTG